MRESSAVVKQRTVPIKLVKTRKNPLKSGYYSGESGLYRDFFCHGDDPVNYLDLRGLWPTALGDSIDLHDEEAYARGTNDCDIWAEARLNDAGIPLPDNWTPAAETTVSDQIDNMGNNLQDEPDPGVNITFHGGNHTMLVDVNEDGTVEIAHISSNPGQVETTTFESVQAFEDDWSPWGDLQYVPVGTPAEPQQTGGKPD